jgi:LmbE family N-acetylglucosaminyl deacetylase
MNAGEATVRALYPAVRNPYAYSELRNDEGLEAWTVSWLWLNTNLNANHYVDVTDTFHRKIAALRAHASQTGHMDNLEDMVRLWGSTQAEAAGLPTGRLAESFRQIKLPD